MEAPGARFARPGGILSLPMRRRREGEALAPFLKSAAGVTVAAMAKDERPADLMGYEALQQEALRGVVRAALTRAISGLPGDHHFYISFRTNARGVSLPDDLKARYPEEMTIVLQNQFWDLTPGETGFSVTLQFSGKPKGLSIPYPAITRFYDPSVQYLLQFNPGEAQAEAEPAYQANPPTPLLAADRASRSEPASGGEPKIVSLDQFRKK